MIVFLFLGLFRAMALHYGWKVFQIPSFNKYGTPFFLPMFNKSMELGKSIFYGFSNGDILFEDGLTETLLAIKAALNTCNVTSIPFLIIGQRRNAYVKTDMF